MTDEQATDLMNDAYSLALCAWKEARGEGAIGCQAVMQVIINRAGKIGFGKTIHDCIYGRNQFTSMSVPTDPEFNLVPPGDEALHIWQACQDLAKKMLTSELDDITGGAHYYANVHNCTSGWFYQNVILSPDHPITAQIGRHTFFR